MIYSRAQWGANEKLRDKSSLHYFEVHAGFVHHTVNANDYTRAEVPGILRSIYAYHTQSRGWSDVGYNFLVDRFGRIWEGRVRRRRPPGRRRPHPGLQRLLVRDVGDRQLRDRAALERRCSRPTARCSPGSCRCTASTRPPPSSGSARTTFQAINGHRDAGSTACPGRYLYAKIPQIRRLAADAQQGWAGRQLESDLAVTAHPDLVVRRASDGQGFILPTGGLLGFGAPRTSTGGVGRRRVGRGLPRPHRRRPRRPLVRRHRRRRRGPPRRRQRASATRSSRCSGLAGRDLVTAVGDLNGDGRNDLVARNTATGRLDAYLGSGNGGFARKSIAGELGRLQHARRAPATSTATVTSTCSPATATARCGCSPATARRTFGTPVEAGRHAGAATTRSPAYGDFNRDGRADLVRPSAPAATASCCPATGNGGFGHPLGPIGRLTGVGAITGGGDIAGRRRCRRGGPPRRRPDRDPAQRAPRHRPPDRDRPEPDRRSTRCSTPATGTATASAT